MTAGSFHVPRTLDEAVEVLGQHGSELTILGGGTIVMGQVTEGLVSPRQVMSLVRAGLDGISWEAGRVHIGATTSLSAIAGQSDLGILSEAAEQIGGPAVRNTATLGGNLLADPPYGDLAVPLLAFDAEVELAGPLGRRTVRLDAFLAERTGRYEPTPQELLTDVSFARPAGQTAYLKLGRRKANTPSVVTVAVRLMIDAAGTCSMARIALGAAGPRAMRASAAESALVGQYLDAPAIDRAAAAAMAECNPFTDALATEWYRRKMVGVFVRRALERASNNAG
jgi:CO/xanthine dehydrogenase FAD-binding subunit